RVPNTSGRWSRVSTNFFACDATGTWMAASEARSPFACSDGSRMRVVILGATKGMGRALARQMAARGDQLFLLGRGDDLERSARDLEVRGAAGQSVGTMACDLECPDTFAPALDAAQDFLGRFDIVVVTAGAFRSQDNLEGDPEALRRLLTVNFTHTVLFCEEA